MEQVVYESYLGIDVGKREHRACAVDLAGQVMFNVPLRNSEQEIDEVLARAGDNCLVIETGLKDDAAYKALLTVPGIGLKTAAQLVLSISIEDFKDHNALASYAGLAPKNRQSGTSVLSVVSSRQGNKQLKNLLIFSCMSLIGGSNCYAQYYESCRVQGMKHKQALKAVARKRLKVIFAVMRDARPYRAR